VSKVNDAAIFLLVVITLYVLYNIRRTFSVSFSLSIVIVYNLIIHGVFNVHLS